MIDWSRGHRGGRLTSTWWKCQPIVNRCHSNLVVMFHRIDVVYLCIDVCNSVLHKRCVNSNPLHTQIPICTLTQTYMDAYIHWYTHWYNTCIHTNIHCRFGLGGLCKHSFIYNCTYIYICTLIRTHIYKYNWQKRLKGRVLFFPFIVTILFQSVSKECKCMICDALHVLIAFFHLEHLAYFSNSFFIILRYLCRN